MDQVLERHSAPEAVETIEATLNYIVNNGEKLFTETGGPGGLDRRSGGTVDPRQVVIHNGRPHVQEFALERDGFRFVRHDTKVADFFDEDEVRRVYYPEMEALVKAESGAARVVVFDHTLRTADDEMRAAAQDPRGRAARAQRLHRMVGAAAGARYPAARKRTRCSPAASPSSRCGGRSAIRSRAFRSRSATRAASRSTISSSRSGAIPTASARPTRSPTIRNTMVLVPAHAARGGDRVQGLRCAQGRPRPLDGAHRLR